MSIRKIAFGVACCLFLPEVSASTKTWTGSAGSDWSTSGNWSPTGAPISGDDIIFDGSTTPTPTTNVNISITPASITFQNGIVCSLTGTGPLTVGGVSSPQLFFNNSSTGQWQSGTTLNLGGNLQLSGSGGTASFATLAGTGNLTVDSGITSVMTQNASSWTSTTITVNGTLNLSGAGSLPSAGTVVTNGTFNISQITPATSTTIGNLSGSGTVTLGSKTLTVGGGGITTFSGSIGGSGALTLTGGGSLTLSGSNNYTGLTTIDSGSSLQAGAVNAFSSSSTISLADAAGTSLDLNNHNQTIPSLSGGGSSGGNVYLGTGTLTLNGIYSTFGGAIQEPGGLTLSGSGTFRLTGTNNTYNGTTTINSGTLQAGVDIAFSPSSSVLLANAAGAALDLNDFNQTIPSLSGGGSSGGNVLLGIATLTVDGTYGTFGGQILETGSLTLSGSGTFQLSGTSNTYSGTTTINSGTLQAGATQAFSSSSAVVLANTAGAVLDLNSFNQTIPSLTGGGSTGGDVHLGSGVLTLDGTYGTFGGAITETGGLTLSGSGTFQLSGTSNTYSGTTTVNSGTLQAGAAQAFSSSSLISLANTTGAALDLNDFNQTISSLSGGGSSGGNVLLGTATLTLGGISSSSQPYGGAIQETGNLILNLTSGTLKLTGANTYSGTTTVTAGTLQAGASNTFSSQSNIILADSASAVLDLNGYDQTIPRISNGGSSGGNVLFGSLIFRNTLTLDGAYGIYDGSIQGRGNVILSGSGTFTLNGANTYDGTTTINSGTLQTGVANALSPSSDIAINGATLDLNSKDNSIPSLSGTGSVTLGAGTLTITGSQTKTYSGIISGIGGGLTQQGSGTTLLTGTNTYSGPTTVNGGVLGVGVNSAGSLTNSNVTVNSGATLKGSGTISQTVTVNSGGTIEGGNSIGTINLGDLTLMTGAHLALEINNVGQSTIYSVTNTATLAGSLDVTVDRGVYQAGTSYTFITTGAAGRIGTFDTTTSNTSGTTDLIGTLTYGSDFVRLNITAPIYALIPTTGLTGNAKAVADYLNRFAADPAIQPVLLAVGALPFDEEQAALNSISPARNAISSWTIQNVLFSINTVTVNRMTQQHFIRTIESSQNALTSLAEFENQLLVSRKPYGKAQTIAKEKSRYAIWAEGVGLFTQQNALNENPAYRSSTGCGLVGADYYGFTQGQVGAAMGYAQTSIRESGTGSSSIQSYLTGLYGTLYIQNGYVEFGLWGVFDQFHNKRNVVYPGFRATAKSSHNGWQLAPHLGCGYDFPFSWGTIEPFASFDAAMLYQNSYSEHGAGVLNMHVKSSTSWLLRAEVGVNAYQVKECTTGTVIFRETLSYVNLAPLGIGSLSGTELVGYPPGFTVTSFTNDLNMLSPGFEIFFKCKSNGFFTSLAYDGEFTIGPGRYTQNEGIGKIGWFF